KAELEILLTDTSAKLIAEEEARTSTFADKRKTEQEVNSIKRDLEDLELNVQKANQDKATKDHQIHVLNEEIAHQE
ncbi:hypothetical protein ACXONR_09690, partial [Streptococcus thermophilus]